MATRPLIPPEQVTQREARIILEFFNSVQTAREIGERIEIANEFDVGERLGRRILARRAELGGQFTSIQQIDAIPYVGPERFTEIVLVLTGRQPGGPAEPVPIEDEVAQLRAAVARLQPGCKLTLTALRAEAYLGQPLDIVASVTDAGTGKRKPNVQLTVSTSWGRLSANAGLLQQQGEVISVRTDATGRIRITLRSATAEALKPAQQTALESALVVLDPHAASPEATRAGLEALVGKYRIERNLQLRKAVDIHFRDARERITAAINRHDLMHTWTNYKALVTVHVHSGDDTGQPLQRVEATSVICVQVRDWLAPFFQIYGRALEADAPLEQEMIRLTDNNTSSLALVDQLLGGIHSYVARSRGLLGGAAGQTLAARAVKRYIPVRANADAMNIDTQLSILPALQLAPQTVHAAGLGALDAVSQARADTRAEVAQVTAPLGDLGVLATQLDSIQASLGDFETNYAAFQTDMQTFNTNFTSFSSDYAQFSSDYGVFSENLPIIIGNLPPIGPGGGGGTPPIAGPG